MKNKWFWGTLLFWAIFSIAIMGRALIFSTLRFDPKIISQYEIKTNGLTQSHRLWMNEGDLVDLLPLINDRLRREGWNSCAGGIDMVPDFLQLDGLVPDISEKLQIKMFQKPGFHLAMGLLQPSGESLTYGWEGILPDRILSLDQELKAWNFHFPVPPDASHLINEKLANLQIGMVILPHQQGLTRRFLNLCQQGNWEASEWNSGTEYPTFFLTRKGEKLMAVLNQQTSQDVITLLNFINRKAFYE